MKKICCFRWAAKAKRFSASGGLCPLTRDSALDPDGGSAPHPRYRLVLRALAMRVHPTFFDLVTSMIHAQVRMSAYASCMYSHDREFRPSKLQSRSDKYNGLAVKC